MPHTCEYFRSSKKEKNKHVDLGVRGSGGAGLGGVRGKGRERNMIKIYDILYILKREMCVCARACECTSMHACVLHTCVYGVSQKSNRTRFRQHWVEIMRAILTLSSSSGPTLCRARCVLNSCGFHSNKDSIIPSSFAGRINSASERVIMSPSVPSWEAMDEIRT